jgi:hypothetical protein
VRRTLLALMIALMTAVLPAGVAGAVVPELVEVAPSDDGGDDDPYVCIRSHILLGEDNPICIHVDPFQA